VVKNGKLFTPKANNSILNGITRRRIIAIAHKRQIETLETDITISQLLEADEIFLTSSSLVIRPILEVFYENKR
jgi:D-alanine transaminase